MKVQRVFQSSAPYVTQADSLREAARKMRNAGVTCIPVLEEGMVIGVVTEHDLVVAAANGVSLSKAYIVDYTHDGSVTVELSDDCETAELKMLAIGCGHLPVVDGDGLVGMVALRDLLLTQANGAPQPHVASRIRKTTDRRARETPAYFHQALGSGP
jgi:CBS domain-containing protein